MHKPGTALLPAVVLMLTIAPAFSQEYAVINLGTLGGSYSSGEALNNSGYVAGASRTRAGDMHGFLFTPEDGLRDLGTLGGDESFARDLNDMAEVVGESSVFPTQRHQGRQTFIWTETTGMRPVTSLGASGHWFPLMDWHYARAISNNGVITGGSQTPWGVTHAFAVTRYDELLDLGAFWGPLTYSASVDVNDHGRILAISCCPWRSCVLAPGREIETLETLGGAYTFASRINALGQIAGSSQTGSGDYHAFFRAADGTMTDLGTFGGASSHACDINGAGEIAGSSDDQSGTRRAFIWDASQGMQDLNDYVHPCDGWDDLSEAFAINDAGQIAGSGHIKKECRGYLLTPALPVAIDIKPYNGRKHVNRIVKDLGIIPVAVLSSRAFDAARVNPATVSFSGSTALRWVMRDVNLDGRPDLVLLFPAWRLNIPDDCGEAVLTGATLDGEYIRGTDTVKIVSINWFPLLYYLYRLLLR